MPTTSCTNSSLLKTPHVTCRNGLVLRQHFNGSTQIITVTGEIDASNAGRIIPHIQGLTIGTSLVVDLSGVEFLSVAGCRELLDIAELCHEKQVPWLLIPSEAAGRTLRLIEHIHVLPSVPSITDALKLLRHGPVVNGVVLSPAARHNGGSTAHGRRVSLGVEHR